MLPACVHGDTTGNRIAAFRVIADIKGRTFRVAAELVEYRLKRRSHNRLRQGSRRVVRPRPTALLRRLKYHRILRDDALRVGRHLVSEGGDDLFWCRRAFEGVE